MERVANIFVQAGGAISAWSLFGLMLLLVVLEWIAPRRVASSALGTRWTSNVALFFVNSYVLRALIPVAAVAWAVICQRRGWGILSWWPVPAWLAIAVGVAALDLVHYLRHLLLHRNEWLWRIHVTHHSDLDFDFTTGLRFHPLDATMSAVVLIGTIAACRRRRAAVLLAELLATSSVLFEHSNVRLPRPVDRVLRFVIVTPDMHRIHHSRAEGTGQQPRDDLLGLGPPVRHIPRDIIVIGRRGRSGDRPGRIRPSQAPPAALDADAAVLEDTPAGKNPCHDIS